MRFYSAYNVAGTKSFRLSSRQFLSEYGGNAQNQPESIREYLIADPGKVILQRDQSGAEAMIVSRLSKAGNYRRLFALGIKPHTYLALNIFAEKFARHTGFPASRYLGLSPDALVLLPEWPDLNTYISSHPDNDREYKLGKITAHAKSYAMGAATFQLNTLQQSGGLIRLSLKESKHFLGTFEFLFPEIIEWQQEIRDTVRTTRKLHNLFGHPRNFHKQWSEELFREALSFIPQSTVGVLTSIAATKIQSKIESEHRDWDLLVNAHDALVMQVPDSHDEIRDAMEALDAGFRQPLLDREGNTYYMKSEGMYGPTWAKKTMKKWKDN